MIEKWAFILGHKSGFLFSAKLSAQPPCMGRSDCPLVQTEHVTVDWTVSDWQSNGFLQLAKNSGFAEVETPPSRFNTQVYLQNSVLDACQAIREVDRSLQKSIDNRHFDSQPIPFQGMLSLQFPPTPILFSVMNV
jgi:hypothetical protein